MSRSPGEGVVIGGGIIGTLCAYYLTRSGWKITVVDRGTFGQGTSSGNCGLVCPSHVLPLAEPGVIGKTFKALFAKNSPFSIKPRLDPSLWSWLLNFARRCNERNMIDAAGAIQPLLESSLHEYKEMVGSDGIACEWETRGLLFPYKMKEMLDAYDATDHLLTKSFHCHAKKLNGEELVELEPALKLGLAGGWYYDDDAHLRPDRLMASLRSRLEGQGVRFLEHCEFQKFSSESGSARSIVTSHGEITADSFVVAAGALTPMLNQHLGAKIPIQPGKGYSLTMPRPAISPSIPLIFPETRVAVTPFQSGYRLGSTMEFAGYDSTIRKERLQLLKDGATPYLQEPYCDPVEQEWYGWRPMTYDSLPIIDRSPILNNVWIAAGHNMLGLSMAPATGKLIAELWEGAPTHINPTPYRVSRF